MPTDAHHTHASIVRFTFAMSVLSNGMCEPNWEVYLLAQKNPNASGNSKVLNISLKQTTT